MLPYVHIFEQIGDFSENYHHSLTLTHSLSLSLSPLLCPSLCLSLFAFLSISSSLLIFLPLLSPLLFSFTLNYALSFPALHLTLSLTRSPCCSIVVSLFYPKLPELIDRFNKSNKHRFSRITSQPIYTITLSHMSMQSCLKGTIPPYDSLVYVAIRPDDLGKLITYIRVNNRIRESHRVNWP